jgi:long-chain acyl-CoA synthetase
MIDHLSHMVLDRAKNHQKRTIFKRYLDNTGQMENISWEDMLNTTRTVSRALISLGYAFDHKIGILANNRPEWTFADIGILNIRAVVVPFYATSNKEQIKHIIDETEMELLFVDNQDQLEKAVWLLKNSCLRTIVSFSEITGSDKNIMSFESFCKLGDPKYDQQLNDSINAARAEDIASIIYTSGTTGDPKGVMLSHGNFMSSFRINYKRLDITDQDISLAFLPLSHIFERAWTFFLIYCEATNIYLSDPKKVIEALPKTNPTVMCVVPRFFEKTYDGIQEEYQKWPSFKQKIFDWSVKIGHQNIGPQKPKVHHSLKYKIAKILVINKLKSIFGTQLRVTPCAGAAIKPEHLKFFHAIGLFVNYGYGATETTATVSCMRTDKYDLNTCGSVMPETKVTIGENDEIIIEGETIFKGYYKKPEETAKVLQGKTFKSGDSGMITPDNYLIMTDRIKDLMKTSGGKYISPQKLELLIGNNKFVEQIVIIGDNRKYVSALIVPSFEALKSKKLELQIHTENSEEVCHNPAVIEFYEKLINQEQASLDSYEQIKRFSLLSEPFTIDNNALTSTLKIKRKLVIEKYENLIDQMYQN